MAGKILVPQLGFEAIPPVLGVWSLNHWTTREAPTVIFWCSIHLVFVAETPVYPGSSLSCSGQFLRDTWVAVSRAEAVSVVWRINHRRQLSGFVQCCSIIHLEGARMQPPPPLPPPQPWPCHFSPLCHLGIRSSAFKELKYSQVIFLPLVSTNVSPLQTKPVHKKRRPEKQAQLFASEKNSFH